MAKATTYKAFYAGKLVGTRKSPRPYLFAVIAQHDVNASRKAAYEYACDKHDRRNFDFANQIACAKAGEPVYHSGHVECRPWTSPGYTQADIEKAIAQTSGGLEAYVARRRAGMIEGFEKALAAGRFEPHVHGWSMSRHNAEKMANATRGKFLAIVPAVQG